jgi:hypothetical protein
MPPPLRRRLSRVQGGLHPLGRDHDRNQLDITEFRDAVGGEWPFLADPERTVQKDLDIQEYTDPHDPMVPHTFVLEPGLRIFSIYNGYWYWGRPSLHELHLDLREVLKKIRPDFDLHAVGLREA